METDLAFSNARIAVAPLVVAAGMLFACEKTINVDDPANGNPPGTSADGGDVSKDPSDVPDSTLAVSGLVSDAETGEPLAGALVATEPPIGQIRTNSQGMYVFAANDFPSLEDQVQTLFRITATLEGYKQDHAQVLLQSGHNRNVDILLARAAAFFRIELSEDFIEFDEADFTGDTATRQLSFWLDTTSAETSSFRVNIPTADRSWVSVSPDTGNVGAAPEFLDVTVTKAELGSGTRQTDITIVVGASQKPMTVKVTLP